MPRFEDLIDALYHKVADKWKTIGLYLEIPKGRLADIAEKCQDDPQRGFAIVLETWLERVHPPATWAAMIEAVEFLGEDQLGRELREKYLHDEHGEHIDIMLLLPNKDASASYESM